MTDEEAFLTRIEQEPEDDLLRLVFADWLEERGDPRSELIRVQCELARLPDGHPRRTELIRREQDLFQRHSDQFLHGLPAGTDVYGFFFKRGFLTKVQIEAEAFLDEAERMFRRHPLIQHVIMLFARDCMVRLSSCPYLARLTVLNLSCNDIRDREAMALAYSPHLGRLQALNLEENRIGMRGAAALARSNQLDALQWLYLRGNPIRGYSSELLRGDSVKKGELTWG